MIPSDSRVIHNAIPKECSTRTAQDILPNNNESVSSYKKSNFGAANISKENGLNPANSSNNNTCLMNYNSNIVDKYAYSNRLNSNNFLSQPVTKSVDIAFKPTSSHASSCANTATTSSSSSGWWFFPRTLQKKNKSLVDHAGSAGLIMESRPKHLPAKTPEEAMQHQLQYEMLIQNSKKKEQQMIEHNKMRLEAKLKEEAATALAVHAWQDDFIPHFSSRKDSKRCRDLWWKGLPSCVRGKVWRLAVGNPLNVSPHLYEMLKQRTEEDVSTNGLSGEPSHNCRMHDGVCCEPDDTGLVRCRKTKSAWNTSWQEVFDSSHHISLDVSRTFPHLCIFQEVSLCVATLFDVFCSRQ